MKSPVGVVHLLSGVEEPDADETNLQNDDDADVHRERVVQHLPRRCRRVAKQARTGAATELEPMKQEQQGGKQEQQGTNSKTRNRRRHTGTEDSRRSSRPVSGSRQATTDSKKGRNREIMHRSRRLHGEAEKVEGTQEQKMAQKRRWSTEEWQGDKQEQTDRHAVNDKQQRGQDQETARKDRRQHRA